MGEDQTVLLHTKEGKLRCVSSPMRVDGRRPPAADVVRRRGLDSASQKHVFTFTERSFILNTVEE